MIVRTTDEFTDRDNACLYQNIGMQNACAVGPHRPRSFDRDSSVEGVVVTGHAIKISTVKGVGQPRVDHQPFR